uniref:Uncharacterized protein LOC113798452 isoform X1 n=1 Tax=Dermatophagoides pteronyssinus TaxID=6956 RepID=A0A6P6YGZ8_DERPT|nr:uncharacterized protein LOC113798452 isoform X1 [Dermatophagoides pteronyssinus]
MRVYRRKSTKNLKQLDDRNRLKLIELVKQHNCYKDGRVLKKREKEVNDESWKLIAKSMNMKVQLCKFFWSRYRENYMVHLKNRLRNPYLERIHPELSFLDDELPKKPKHEWAKIKKNYNRHLRRRMNDDSLKILYPELEFLKDELPEFCEQSYVLFLLKKITSIRLDMTEYQPDFTKINDEFINTMKYFLIFFFEY